MGQKGFSLLFILAGIAIAGVLAGGGYYYLQNTKKVSDSKEAMTSTSPSITPSLQPSVDPVKTTDWKIYSDSKNGYSFSYPPNWNIVQDVSDNLIITNFEPTTGNGGLDQERDKGKGSINFTLTKSDKPQEFKDYVLEQIKMRENYEEKEDYKLEESSISGKSSITIIKDFQFSDLYPSKTIFIEYKPSYYMIISPAIDFPSYEDDFNKILQTIKFNSI